MNILTIENNLTVPVRTLKQAKENGNHQLEHIGEGLQHWLQTSQDQK
jgi:hypothetical protein